MCDCSKKSNDEPTFSTKDSSLCVASRSVSAVFLRSSLCKCPSRSESLSLHCQRLTPFQSVGDLFDAFMAWMVIQTCKKIDGGLPSNIVNKMTMNLVLDFAIGLMPFLGDLADTIFQCNVRNANLLEAYLSEQGEARLRAQPAAASSRGTNPRPVEPAITNAQVHPQQPMTDPVGPPPGYERDAPSQNKVRRPSTTTKQTSGSRAAWFRFGKGASRVQDPEQGVAH